jgi:hypothetical protein
LQLIAAMVLKACSELNPDSRRFVLSELSYLEWYPACASEEALRLRSGDGTDKRLNIVTCTRNLFVVSEQWCPHFMVSSVNIYDQFAETVAQLCPAQLNAAVDAKLIVWMSRTGSFYCSIAFMAGVYRRIHAEAKKVSNGSTPHPVLALLESDCPLIWVPENLHTTEGDNEIVLGSMCKLAQVVRSDPSTKFQTHDSPVRSLEKLIAYHRINESCTARTALAMWTRKIYCYACQASEGMYGTVGKSAGTAVGGQKCRCEDSAFSSLSSKKHCVVKNSPSLTDSILLLKSYRDQFQALNTENDGVSSIETKRNKIMQDVRELLESISREIWKCFHIDNCLHAYSAKSLQEMIQLFRTDKLLPTMDGSFVSTVPEESMQLMVVDDKTLFKLFEDSITAGSVNRICWIDGLKDTNDSVSSTDLFEDNVVMYDLATYEEKCAAFLNMDTSAFEHHARHIPMQTFFAPHNVIALMNMLRIPKFSNYLTVRWDYGESRPETIGFVSKMNTFLKAIQAYLLKSDTMRGFVPFLATTQRLKTLFQMRIQQCSFIRRNVTLDLKLLLDMEHCDRSQTLHYNYEVGSNTLFVDKNMSYELKRDVSIRLIMKVIRVELALKTLNQNTEFMTSLQVLLEKFFRTETAELKQFLEFEDLSLPDDSSEIWTLEAAAVIEDDALRSTSSHTSEAEEAYQKMKKSLKAEPSKKSRSNKEHSPDESEAARRYDEQQAKTAQILREQLQASLKEDSAEGLAPGLASSAMLPEPIAEEEKIVIVNTRPAPEFPVTARSDVLSRFREVHLNGGGAEIIHSEHEVRDGPHMDHPSNGPAHNGASTTQQQMPVGEGGMISDSADPQPRFDSSMVSSRRGDRSITHIDIDEDMFKALLADYTSVEALARLGDGVVEATDNIPLSDNVAIGRFGEQLAYMHLRDFYAKDSGVKVIWQNKEEEIGYPYDIIIKTGDKELKCEVKTRLRHHATSTTRALQWFISSKEIEYAAAQGPDYFCILIGLNSVQVGEGVGGGGCRSVEVFLVGKEYGLAEALQRKDANLLIQISK